MSTCLHPEAPARHAAPRTIQMLGLRVQALPKEELNGLIGDAVRADKRVVIANHNLHSACLYHQDERMREFFARAHYTHIDGMPLVFYGRLLGSDLRREDRVTYVDWFPSLLAEAVRNDWRIFYVGSKPGVADRGAEVVRERFPGLQIRTAHGYFDARPGSAENERLIEEINEYRPHVLMVGMGMPRQEAWILDNLERLEANAVLPSGACIDYFAGAVATPPRWMGRVGLEWLYRLVNEPRRLAHRYLVEPWSLTPLVWRDLLSLRARTGAPVDPQPAPQPNRLRIKGLKVFARGVPEDVCAK